MERLEAKKVKGNTYYYYSSWKWTDGRCRRVWQVYLGRASDIYQNCKMGGPLPSHAEIFQRGTPVALWNEAQKASVIQSINKQCPKRKQGLSTGEYITIAAINRAIRPTSKRSMWEWLSNTSLIRALPKASADSLASQRFWDHMDLIQIQDIDKIWTEVLQGVIEREDVDLSSISYDGTNFYTFIDSFNTRCELPKRGKNKQKRSDLRQISYALFCASDGHLPLFFDTYEGNRHDSKQFPLMLNKFYSFLETVTQKDKKANITVIFDKGNNKLENLQILDDINLHFVGSLKSTEAKEFLEIPNDSPQFIPCVSEELEGTKYFCTTKNVYGKNRTIIVTFNQSLFETQWLSIQAEIKLALEELSEYKETLENRIKGIEKRGKSPGMALARKKCEGILNKEYLKEIIVAQVVKGPKSKPRLKYTLDTAALSKYADTHLGKTIIMTTRHEWSSEKIIEAYRSQYIIEGIFKEMKSRGRGNWWPLFHWTDSKIKVHALYCSLALLFRSLIMRRIKKAGMDISMERMLKELDGIREVVNVYHTDGKKKKTSSQIVLSKLSEVQQALVRILGLEIEKTNELGCS